MQLFHHEKPKHSMRYLFVSLGLFAAVFVLFSASLNTLSGKTKEAQQKTLEDAIYRSISHCYALNGYYPESLDALIETYGITYDADQYFVDYQIWSENVMPDVTIIPR